MPLDLQVSCSPLPNLVLDINVIYPTDMHSQLDQTRRRLESLIEINQLLMSTVEPDDLLKAILESALRLFSVAGCSIGLVDTAKQQLVFTFMAGGASSVHPLQPETAPPC